MSGLMVSFRLVLSDAFFARRRSENTQRLSETASRRYVREHVSEGFEERAKSHITFDL